MPGQRGQRGLKLALILSLPSQINQTGLIILSLIKAHFHAEPIWSLNNGFKPKIETFFCWACSGQSEAVQVFH